MVQFLKTYSEANAILLPGMFPCVCGGVYDGLYVITGRIPGYKNSDLQLLPSSTTKRAVWEKYVAANSETTARLAKYSTFCYLWRLYAPRITIMKPMTDLCWICQKNSTAMIRSANKTEEEKSVVITN